MTRFQVRHQLSSIVGYSGPTNLHRGSTAPLCQFRHGSTIDAVQRLCDEFSVLPRAEAHRVADQMDNAQLNNGRREGSLDRIRKALEALNHHDQQIGHPPAT